MKKYNLMKYSGIIYTVLYSLIIIGIIILCIGCLSPKNDTSPAEGLEEASRKLAEGLGNAVLIIIAIIYLIPGAILSIIGDILAIRTIKSATKGTIKKSGAVGVLVYNYIIAAAIFILGILSENLLLTLLLSALFFGAAAFNTAALIHDFKNSNITQENIQ